MFIVIAPCEASIVGALIVPVIYFVPAIRLHAFAPAVNASFAVTFVMRPFGAAVFRSQWVVHARHLAMLVTNCGAQKSGNGITAPSNDLLRLPIAGGR